MENFKTEVNVPPGAKVQFELHYQEVKWRRLGSYEHRLHLQPGRLARHLEVSRDSQGAQSPHPLLAPGPDLHLLLLSALCGVRSVQASNTVMGLESTRTPPDRLQCGLSS